jgi:hypothetical protein
VPGSLGDTRGGLCSEETHGEADGAQWHIPCGSVCVVLRVPCLGALACSDGGPMPHAGPHFFERLLAFLMHFANFLRHLPRGFEMGPTA